MVQAIISINDEVNQILNIVKSRHNLKDKSEAIELVTKEYAEEILELELRPEYVKKLKKIEKEGYVGPFNSVEELDKHIKSHA